MLTDPPTKPNAPADNLTEWLAWAYWDMRQLYFTGDNKLANRILDDALTKLARAWELSRLGQKERL